MRNKVLRRRFALILAVYTLLTLLLWTVYQITVFSHIRETAQETVAITEESLLTDLNDEFSRMKITASVLAGSTYMQEFLSESDVTAYYEKAGAVSEMIRRITYPAINADNILTFTADGSHYRFMGGISRSAADKIFTEVIHGGLPAYSMVELDGTEFFCLAELVYLNGQTAAPAGYVVILLNIDKVRRALIKFDISGIDTAVILDDEILISSEPDLDGKNASELERRYGSVTVMPVMGSNLYAATAITKHRLHFAEQLFLVVSAAMILMLLVIVIILYRILSSRMVEPMLKNADTLQMGLLKTQINAHFVVNTIICIESLARQGENEKAATAAGHLAGMLKEKHESETETNIFEQLENLNRYIEIMNIRANGKFNVEMDIDDVLVEYRMPAQILQPLTENALTHGLGNKSDDCKLTITGRIEDGCAVLEVGDNGRGMEQSAIRALQEMLDGADEWDYDEYKLSGVALINMQKRIRALYGKDGKDGGDYGLKVCGAPGAGMTFTVRLPLIKD